MERGNAAEFKNKSLDEIEIDMENIDEDIEGNDGPERGKYFTMLKFVSKLI